MVQRLGNIKERIQSWIKDGVEEEEGAVEPTKQEEQEEENESLIPADPDFFEKMELERELANLR